MAACNKLDIRWAADSTHKKKWEFLAIFPGPCTIYNCVIYVCARDIRTHNALQFMHAICAKDVRHRRVATKLYKKK